MSCNTWTEDWGGGVEERLYDSSSVAYDEASRGYDGALLTAWDDDTDKSTAYMQIGLCIDLATTSGVNLLNTSGANLTVNNL